MGMLRSMRDWVDAFDTGVEVMNKYDYVSFFCAYALFFIGSFEGFYGRYDHATYAVACACFLRIGIKG